MNQSFTGLAYEIGKIKDNPIIKAVTSAEIKTQNEISLALRKINIIKKQVDAVKRSQGNVLKLLDLMGASGLAGKVPSKASIQAKYAIINGIATTNLNAIDSLLSIKGNTCFKSGMKAAKDIQKDISKFVNKMLELMFGMLKFPMIMEMIYKTLNFIISIVKKTGLQDIINNLWTLLNSTNPCTSNVTFINSAKNDLHQMAISIGFTVNSPISGKPRYTLEEIDIRTAMKNDIKNTYPSFNNTDTDDCFDSIGEMNNSWINLANNTETNINAMITNAQKKPLPKTTPSKYF